jgi:hypothetical protein
MKVCELFSRISSDTAHNPLIFEKFLIVLPKLLSIAKEQMLATPETDSSLDKRPSISAKT